jgi:hypothetical protein
MTQYIELDWETPWSPLYGSPLIIPENTMLWRGYDIRYDPIPDRYAYYSGMEIVMEYAKKPNRELGCFITTKPLKLMDIRFMINILERIIQTNQADAYLNDFASTILSFGICSLGHQIKLLKKRYANALNKSTSNSKIIQKNIQKMIDIYNPSNLIEQRGVRIAETTNDGQTMGFLQELFKNHFDGFISPRLYTIFHTEKDGQLNPEMILFNPKYSKLKQLINYPSNIITKSVSEYIESQYELINLRTMKQGDAISMRMYLSGGMRNINNKIHHLDEYEDKLNINHKHALQSYNKAREAGKRWHKKIMIINLKPVPDFKLSEFTHPFFK